MRNAPVQYFSIHVGDTRTPLGATLVSGGPNGAALDLTGLTVKFKAVNTDGTVAIAETTTGVIVTDAATGEVQYDFQAADVATAKTMYGYFLAYESGESDTFPVKSKQLQITVEGDT